jgi:acetolactate synthase-1/3 small subunit
MRHTISVLCDDTPGVMTRVSGLFSRRGFNIESLSVGHTELPGKSRFTIVTTGDDTVLEQVRKQLQKLVHVIKAWDIKHAEAVEREHALLKIEVAGDTSSVDNAFNLFKDYHILESIRTGKIALERGPSRVMKK